MQLEATILTLKDSPVSVSFGGVPASRAFLRSVSGIDKPNGDALSQSLVFNKILEHSKSPAMDLPVALPPKVCPAPDVSQLLKDNNGANIGSSMPHQPLANTMQCIPVEAVLPVAKPSKDPLSTSGAFTLKGPTHSEIVVPSPVKPSSFEELICRGNSDILNPQVDPNYLAGGIRRWDKLFENKMQIESLVSIDKVSRAKLPGFIFEITPLIIAKGKTAPYPMPVGRESAIVRLDGAGADIIPNGGEAEVGLGALPFKARFHRFSYLITGRAGKICRQLKQASGKIINLVVQSNLVGEAPFPGDISNPVASVSICLHRLRKEITVFRKELNLDSASNLLHSSYSKVLLEICQVFRKEVRANSSTG